MRKIKHGQMLKIALIFGAVFAWVLIPFLTQNKVEAGSGDNAPVSTATAILRAPNGAVNPHGEAVLEIYANGNRELEVEVEDVNLSNGTALTVFINGNSIGQFNLSQQKGKLKLRSEDGQNLPNINNGTTVEVRNGSTVIVSGAFSGGTTTPSPSVSPSGSPTGSPSGSPSPSVSPSASPSPNAGDLFAGLNGATIGGVLPSGLAKFEIHSSRVELDIRVKQVNLPPGTSLDVIIDNVSVGQLVLENNGGTGRLRLRSDKGDTVPTVPSGSTIRIINGNTTILSGAFTGATATPSPSPSASPNGSPSPSPSPSRGRLFEAHLSGNQVTPPVSTAARGEVKVILHQNETQATIVGKFENLSSAQTGARIEVLIGTTSTVFDFGVIGGTKGNFPAKTISVTPVQVQELRAGLWSVVITSVNNPNGEISGTLTHHSDRSDFDGDGNNDLAVFRPSNATWYTMNSQGFSAQTLGGSNDIPVSGDYDGDGKSDRAVFRNVNGAGVWEINRSSDGGTTSRTFGFATDAPVRGDFDGDGINDIAVFRPSSGTWYVQKSSDSGFIIVSFGISEDVPMASDLDGDGKDDITVFRPSTGAWYWIRSSDSNVGIVGFGMNGDKPLIGDFDGDGVNDISVFRPSSGVWYIYRSSDKGYDVRWLGTAEDIPVAGNYDGDDKTDIAVFRPSNGVWYIWRSSDGTIEYNTFGLSGDVPLNAR